MAKLPYQSVTGSCALRPSTDVAEYRWQYAKSYDGRRYHLSREQQGQEEWIDGDQFVYQVIFT